MSRPSQMMPRRPLAAAAVFGLALVCAPAARATNVVATIPVGSFPHGVAVNPVTNRVYVTNSGGQASGYPGNTVSVIDGATNTVLTTVTVGTGAFGVAVNPTTNRIYVSNRSDDTVSVIDGVTNTLIGGPIAVGNQPEEIQVNPGTGRVYVANWNGSGAASVTVIDGATSTVLTTVNLAGLNGANGVALNRAANLVYVTTFGSDSLAVIDGVTNAWLTTVPAGDQPNGVKYDATTNRIYVANFGIPDTLTILNAAGYAVVATVNLKAAGPWDYDPQGIAVNVFANKVYVANARTSYPNAVVSVVNLVSNLVEEEVAVGVIAREADANPVTRLAYVANYGSDTVSVLSDPSPCCDQSAVVSDVAGPPPDRAVRVFGTGRFRLDWKALTGGSPVTLIDLAEDPGMTLDLGGGDPSWNSYPGLFFDSIWYQSFTSGAPAAWYGWSAGDGVTPDAKLELLEATATRVKLRQETFYHHTLTQGFAARIPGLKGYGDYSVYGVGRLALKWRRQASTAVTWGGGAGAVGSADLDWTVHKDPGVPALSAWTAYRPAGALPPNTTGGAGSGADDFLLMKSDYTATSPNVKTDLLVTLYSDWADAQVTAHNDPSAGTDKAAWLAWDDTRTGAAGPHIRSWTAGQGETFNFLTSWKPTNLGLGTNPWLDGAVVTRASDYRTPATITLSQGSRWADADENTPTGSPADFYNESEAAYLFDLHPTQGVVFTMSASLAQPRYTPFLKVRQWRWFQEPVAVSLGGVRLTNDVDFKADLKPLARAFKTGDLSWHCTLQDAASCSPPDVGTGGGLVLGSSSVVPARYGNGLAITTNDAYVVVPQADFNFGVGALDFWYRPNYDSTNLSPHPLFNNTGGAATDYDCFWLEHTGGNLVLRAYRSADNQNCNTGGVNLFTITATGGVDYHWRAGEWVHLRAEWSSGSYMRLLVDGRVVGSFGTYSGVGWDVGQTRIGSCQINCAGGGGSRNADGIVDEPHVYVGMGATGNPEPLAYGGLAGDAREALGSAASNAVLLSFAVGAGSKGQYLYMGADSRFRGLNMSFTTPGGGVAAGALVWQYWRDDGAGTEGWADLEAVTGWNDGTADFTRNGVVKWDADPADWKAYSVSGGPDLYYVRVHLSGVNYSPSPVESLVKTDILLFQYCGDLTADSSFIIPSFATTEVTLQSFTATGADRAVRLEWRTASELRNLGFHVYRGPSADGPWQRLTTTLVPGLGSSAVGQAYAYTDPGLSNGTRYFYRLEDVDASSKTTSHGPVSAVPQAAAAAAGEPREDPAPDEGDADASAASCPGWVVSAYAASVGADAATASLRCTRHGDPEATAFSVLSRNARQATLELRTGGFYALHEGGGAVRVFVPGFDLPQDEAEALPYRRLLVEAVVGRRAALGGVRALETEAFRGLAPSQLGRAEMQVRRDGTVRAGRRAVRATEATSRPAAARERAVRLSGTDLVRLLPSVFQGEAKSAVVELRPLRWDATRRQLVLSKLLRVKLLFTGREAGESGRGSRGRAPGRGPRRDKPASGEVLARLHTASAGLYAATFEELLPGRGRGVAVSQLRLERQGEAVAFHVEPQTGTFGPRCRLYFYAEREAGSTDYAGEVAYELVSARQGLRMAVEPAVPGPEAVGADPVVTQRFEVNRYYQPGLLEAPDPWLWEAAASGASRALAFTLSGVSASGTAELEVALQGASESGQPVDHHVSLSVNGVAAGEAQFAGKNPYRMSLSLPASSLREGANELQLTNVADTGVTSLVFLDRFAVAHPQRSMLGDGRLSAVWSESGPVSIAGVSGELAIVDVTGSGAAGSTLSPSGAGQATPRWLAGYQVAGGVLRFQALAGHRYEVWLSSALLSPRIEPARPSGLKSAGNQADYLLVAPRAFLPAAEPLLARRQDQGLVARGVSFEEIADEFGHGQASAEAIRGFLSHAYQSWSRPSPRYVVLLGDGSSDPRNFTGMAQPAPLPVLWTKTSYLWTASDPLLAAVNGDDALPDVAIGRLPAATVEQANALVQKLVAWEESGQGLAGPAALVADNPDVAGDFEADVQDVRASFLAGREASVLKLGERGAATRGAIQAALDSGLSYLSYVGHGGAAVWASENVWNSWDAASLRAQSTQPLLLTLNCLNGYFVAPSFESLSESLVKAEGRGAIAAVSPSGLSLDGPAHQYHRALMAELTNGRHERLGDAVLAAQRAYAASGLMPELLSVYHLLGDPALVIR